MKHRREQQNKTRTRERGFPVPWGRALGWQRGAAGEGKEEEKEERWWQLPRQARVGIWADGEICNSTRRKLQCESQRPKCGNGWEMAKLHLGWGMMGRQQGQHPRRLDTGEQGNGVTMPRRAGGSK